MEATYVSRIGELTGLLQARKRELLRFAWHCMSVRGAQPQSEDIEDALSEAYLAAATRLRLEPSLVIDNLEPWFRKVLFFCCLKRVEAKHKFGITSTIEELETEENVLQLSPHWDNQIALRQLVDSLEDDQREVLTLTAEGLVSREIATRLSKSTDNVRQIKSRAIATLKAALRGKKDER